MSTLRFALQWLLVFLGFAALAFGTAVAFGEVWGKLWSLWLLVGIAGWQVSLLPRLRDRGAPVGAPLAFAATFFLLWLSTENPETSREAAQRAIEGSFLVLPIVAVAGVLSSLIWVRGAKPASRATLVALVPPMLLGLLVAYFSGGAGGAGGWTEAFARLLGITLEQAQAMTFGVRKSAHFVFYGLLAAAAFRPAWKGGLKAVPAAVWALVWAVMHATFDELRQRGTTARSGSGWDVVLDLAGIAVALAICLRVVRSEKPARAESAP